MTQALHHAVNGFFDIFKSKPMPQAQPVSRAALVKVESRYNEGDDESLLESANSLPRPTLKALEKQLRSDGFKGALVSGWGQGQRGGFTVRYDGEKYEFEISENVTPRPVGEIGRLVRNSRHTGILSDGTRVNVYRYQGTGDEWTAALHYPYGGYSALVMSGGSAEFDEHNLEGPHMGTFIPWDGVPGNIKREIEQRAVEPSMVANGISLTESDKRVVRAFVGERAGDSRLLDTDGRKLDKMGLGGETVAFWNGGRIAIVSTESAKSDESIIRAIIKVAGPGIVDFSYARKGHRKHELGAPGRAPMETNGRGVYHETAAGKHDMVLHQDHRGAWRIDLVTSTDGNHLDVTGPNQGYGSPEDAFQAALDVQRTRGIRGKSHVYIADRDGNLSDYEPMEANGRATNDGTQEGDYVLAVVDRDANIGLYRVVRGGKWLGPIQTSANVDTIIGFMEGDAHKRGIHAAAVFEQDGDRFTQVGNMVGSRYQESGGYQGNGHEPNARGRGARRAVGCICGAKFANPHTSACIAHNNPPRFKAGDRVERDDGSARGEVAIVGNYDETIGGYRYKVQQDDGARIYWNESSMRPEGHATNGRATVADAIAARELDLYIANTYELVGAPNSIGKAIDASMKRKVASGKYDPALAPKGWQALVDAGAKKYEKEFGSDSPIFNAATRRQVAADFAAAWEEENGMRANGVTNETNLRQAIVDALHQRSRKHLEIWRTVSQRYPSTAYADFDALMGKMEMDGTITLTGSRGPNTYKLT